MQHVRARVRPAIGAAVIAVMGAGTAPFNTLAGTPPTSEPTSSEPPAESVTTSAGTFPTLDPEREAVVESIMTQAAADDFTLDRECLAGIIAQVPDADIPPIIAELEEPPITAISAEATAMTIDEAPSATEGSAAPDADSTTPDSTTPESTRTPAESSHELSAEAEALAGEIIDCLRGDADPLLVAEALAAFESDESAQDFDLACVENVLSALDDATLELLIEVGGDPAVDMPSDPMTSVEEAAVEDSFLLFACLTDLRGPISAPPTTLS